MPLPEFPHFVQPDLTNKAEVEAITAQFPPYSDCNFVSFFAWNIHHIGGLARLGDNLVLRFTDYLSDDVFLSLIGKVSIAQTLEQLLDYCAHHHISPTLQLVSQTVVDQLSPPQKSRFIIEPDRDNYDYIISVEDLYEFRTNRYSTKKRFYNRLIRTYGNRLQIELLDPSSTMPEIQRVFEHWQRQTGRLPTETRNERLALERCLVHAKALGVDVHGAYIDDELVAFTVNQLLTQGWAMGHFFKTDPAIDGLSAYLLHNVAQYLHNHHITRLNIEQDLGEAGARTYKLSYHPIDFLQKYSITRA